MAKIHQRFLSTIIPQEKDRDSLNPRSETLSGEDSTWMVDLLEIPSVVDCFIFFSFYTIELLWLFQNLSFVLSSERKNQIVIDVTMYILLTKREVKMAGYWPSSLFAFLWTETKSRSIKT